MGVREYGRYFRKVVPQRTKAEMYGLIQGVLADGFLSDVEAATVLKWLERNERVRDIWPANVLHDRIGAMLEDGVLDSEEQRELLGILTKYIQYAEQFGLADEKLSVPCAPSITVDSPFETPPPHIRLDAKFVITGDFAIGTRPFVMHLITSRGGDVVDHVSKATDYVVVGEFGSDLWVGKNYGTKIERAIGLRQRGAPIYVVQEQHWAQALER